MISIWVLPFIILASGLLGLILGWGYAQGYLFPIWCWLVGHDKKHGGKWESDYCGRCYAQEPQETTTLPVLLNRAYCWLVERDWRWFNRLDEWLYHHVPKKWWPSWWEY